MSIGHLRLFVVAVLATALVLLTPSAPMAASAAHPSRAFLKQLEKGEALMEKGKYEKAVLPLQKAEELAGEPSAPVLLNLAVCFNHVGKYDESEAYARSALKAAESPSDRANALFMLVDHGVEAKEAEAALREVLELTDGQANKARYRLGKVLQRQGRHREAHAAFSEYLERQPHGEHSAEARRAMDSLDCWLEQSDSAPDLPKRCRSPIGASTWCRDGLTVDIVPPTKIFSPNPHYTEEARKRRIQGTVIVQTIIDKKGDVRCLTILEGLPLGLNRATAEALSRWKFKPATLDGEPVAVIYNMTTSFAVGPGRPVD